MKVQTWSQPGPNLVRTAIHQGRSSRRHGPYGPYLNPYGGVEGDRWRKRGSRENGVDRMDHWTKSVPTPINPGPHLAKVWTKVQTSPRRGRTPQAVS
jgi:hypothetical protein